MKSRRLLATLALMVIPLSACSDDNEDADQGADRPSTSESAAPAGEDGEDGDAGDGQDDAATDEAGTPIETAELVALIEDGMADVSTFRVTSDAGENEDGGVGAGIAGTAEYDYRVSPPSARTVSMLEAGKPTEMIAVGDDLYIQVGESWTKDTRFNADGTDQHDAVAMLVELVGDAETVVRNEEQKDGDAYTATLKPGTITMRTTIRFDEQGRLAAFSVSTTDAEGATSSLGSSAFTDYGAEVSIKAPPAAELLG